MIIIDSGPLIAAFDRSDQHHDACTHLLRYTPGVLFVPPTVVAEVGYMITRQRFGSDIEASFLRTLADGTFTPLDLDATDYARMADLVEQYADLPLGSTDASVVALTERLRVERIATLDRRHFQVVKPQHCPAFELVPCPRRVWLDQSACGESGQTEVAWRPGRHRARCSRRTGPGARVLPGDDVAADGRTGLGTLEQGRRHPPVGTPDSDHDPPTVGELPEPRRRHDGWTACRAQDRVARPVGRRSADALGGDQTREQLQRGQPGTGVIGRRSR